MKIQVVRAFSIAGEVKPVGDIVEVETGLGMELIGLRKAIGHVEPEAAPETEAKRPRKPKAEADTPAEPDA